MTDLKEKLSNFFDEKKEKGLILYLVDHGKISSSLACRLTDLRFSIFPNKISPYIVALEEVQRVYQTIRTRLTTKYRKVA